MRRDSVRRATDLEMLATRLVFVLISLFIKTKGNDDVTISCSKHDITVEIQKTFIPDFYLEDLSLLDSKCDFERVANYTHFKLVIPLIGCGTTSHHTNTSIIYTNMVKNKPFDESAVINRLPILELPITCKYPKKVATSYADLGVKDTILQLDVEDGSGEFDLQMGLYRDSSYVDQFEDFPVTVPLNQRLYFQLNVDALDKGLSIIADECYATPTRSTSTKSRYIIIEQRCPKDSTFKTHASPTWAQRFSFQAFQFVHSTDIPYVFIHCEVRLCNATDKDSSCAKGCEESSADVQLRQRRDSTEDKYTLEQGPIVIIRDEDKLPPRNMHHKDSKFSAPQWVLVGMGFICVLCFIVVLYTRHQLTKVRSDNIEKTARL